MYVHTRSIEVIVLQIRPIRIPATDGNTDTHDRIMKLIKQQVYRKRVRIFRAYLHLTVLIRACTLNEEEAAKRRKYFLIDIQFWRLRKLLAVRGSVNMDLRVDCVTYSWYMLTTYPYRPSLCSHAHFMRQSASQT